jgi:hypothetical protein
MSIVCEVHGSRNEYGPLLVCHPLRSHVLVPLLHSKFLIKSARGQEKSWSGSIVDVLAAGSQRKQKHKTTCCGSNFMCFTHSNTRVCFASLQESRRKFTKTLMGAQILNVRFQVRSQICEKRLLASSCLSVHPHGKTRLTLDGFY